MISKELIGQIVIIESGAFYNRHVLVRVEGATEKTLMVSSWRKGLGWGQSGRRKLHEVHSILGHAEEISDASLNRVYDQMQSFHALANERSSKAWRDYEANLKGIVVK